MENKRLLFLISILVVFTVISINKFVSASCYEINVFKGDFLYRLIIFIRNVILGIGIWIIGYLLFKRIKLNKKQSIIYFVIISLLSTSNTILKIWKSNFSTSSQIVKSICNKSNDDGMVFEAKNLNGIEYNYLIKGGNWLPESPPESKSINIHYYRDEFLGDYTLSVELELPSYITLDLVKYPKWKSRGSNNYYFGGYQD